MWLLLVYVPVAHWVWGGGWLAAQGTIDFAGGIVVHTTAGVSALVVALMIGPRRGFPETLQPPHSPGLTMAGAGMLWVGWFGFNGGSALAASGAAAMAIIATHLAACAAALTWMALEWARLGKPTSVGLVTGGVAGLATITPASGYVGPMGAIAIGLAAGALCLYATPFIKRRWRIDDTLDVFAVHGIGGMLGTFLVAFFTAVRGRRGRLCRRHGPAVAAEGAASGHRRGGAVVGRDNLGAGQGSGGGGRNAGRSGGGRRGARSRDARRTSLRFRLTRTGWRPPRRRSRDPGRLNLTGSIVV